MRALASLPLVVTTALAQTARDDLTVRVDPRVELLSIVFRLAGNPEYQKGRVDSYTDAVDAYFAEHRRHRVVRLADTLRRGHGVSYDAVMGMAMHLDEVRSCKLTVPWKPRPPSLDARWPDRDARRFLRELRAFVRDTDFEAWFASQSEVYDTAVTRMQTRLRDSAELGWFDEFFGARPSARFELALGMLNGGACYGPHVAFPDGREDLHCVLGVWQTDDDGAPAFDEKVVPTVIHEFCHSYCNRLVDAHWGALEGSADALWPHVADQMRQQAYGNARTMMRESLVRACVVRYEAATGGPRKRLFEVRAQERRGFLWTGGLSDLLAEYEASRDDHPTLDAFMPKVAKWFADYAARFDERLAAFPTVVAITPENGAIDVDPGLRAITVTFDREMMDGAWAFVGGGPKYPKTTGKPSYDEACKVVTLPVQLEPSHDYELWLNRGKFDSFRSADGDVLRPVRVRFRTRAK